MITKGINQCLKVSASGLKWKTFSHLYLYKSMISLIFPHPIFLLPVFTFKCTPSHLSTLWCSRTSSIPFTLTAILSITISPLLIWIPFSSRLTSCMEKTPFQALFQAMGAQLPPFPLPSPLFSCVLWNHSNGVTGLQSHLSWYPVNLFLMRQNICLDISMFHSGWDVIRYKIYIALHFLLRKQ